MGNAERILGPWLPARQRQEDAEPPAPGTATPLALQLGHTGYSCSTFFKEFYNADDLVCVGEDHTWG